MADQSQGLEKKLAFLVEKQRKSQWQIKANGRSKPHQSQWQTNSTPKPMPHQSQGLEEKLAFPVENRKKANGTPMPRFRKEIGFSCRKAVKKPMADQFHTKANGRPKPMADQSQWQTKARKRNIFYKICI